MKKYTLLLISLLSFSLFATAQTKVKWFKSVRKAQATVYTYNADGAQIGSSNAVFVGNDGNILTQYDILVGASRAEVVLSTGKKYAVNRVVSCSSLYNIARLATACTDVTGLKVAANDATAQTPVLIMPTLGKVDGILCQNATVIEATSIEGGEHRYYTVKGNNDDASLNNVFNKEEDCLPILNDAGELIALTQHDSNSTTDNQAFGVSARFVQSIVMNGMAAMKSDYSSLLLPVQLPADESQARTFLFLMPKSNEARYEDVVQQFINAYPTQSYGYTTLVEWYATKNQDEQVRSTFEKALTNVKGDGRDEVFFTQSRYDYTLALQGDTTLLPTALESTRQAYAIVPQPIYRKQEAEVLYSMLRYADARDIFIECGSTALRSAEIFVNAAQCVRMLRVEGAEEDSVYVTQLNILLDSAVACYTKPYPAEAASVIWQRAQARHEAHRYREAVTDYNEFEHLVAGRVNAEFYYQRSHSELYGRMYQQALDDAERACQMTPDDVQYLVHNANVHIRLGQADQARPLLKRAAELGEVAAQEWLDKHPEN